MDSLKKTRITQKVAFLKSYNKLLDLIEKDNSYVNVIDELKSELKFCISKAERLEKIYNEIMSNLIEKKFEYHIVEDFLDKFSRTQIKANRIINDFRNLYIFFRNERETNSEVSNNTINKNVRKFKLLKL